MLLNFKYSLANFFPYEKVFSLGRVKKFGSEPILGPKKVVQNKFWVQKIFLGPNNMLLPKKFGSKNILVQTKIIGPKFFLFQTDVGSKKFWALEKFWVKKCWVQKICWVKKNFGVRNHFLAPNKFSATINILYIKKFGLEMNYW